MDKSACFNRFAECAQVLADIQPIDYHFAQNAVHQITKHADCELVEAQQTTLFMLLIACHSALRNGHVCTPLSQLAGETWFNDETHQGFYFEPSLCQQLFNKFDKSQPLSQSTHCLFIVDANCLYIKRYWHYEIEVANRFNALFDCSDTGTIDCATQHYLAQLIQQLFANADCQQNEIDWQKVAVASSVSAKVNIICGGPGTGKTYTVARLLAVQAAKQKTIQADTNQALKILMAAPTGKAAQRLTESLIAAKGQMQQQQVDPELLQSIPETALTLHRLLGYHPYKVGYTYNQHKPLECDLLLIDEVSMIDLAMMCHVLRALPKHATLIMLGDADQLPSVETGNLLADLAPKSATHYPQDTANLIKTLTGQQVEVMPDSPYAHITFLQKTHRFSGEIGAIAKEVIQGQDRVSWQRLLAHQQNGFTDFSQHELAYVEFSQLQTWLEDAIARYYSSIEKCSHIDQAFELLNQFRILTSMRKGAYGVEALNQLVERQIKQQLRVSAHTQHYKGRPIMITQNDYQHGLFNGDIGIVWPEENNRLVCYFETDSGVKSTSLAKLPSHETVYAMTIHKTQGSEFKHVGLILPEMPNPILTPELIYTGITRAKKAVTVLSKREIWDFALTNRQTRSSNLAARLYQHD
ncbi:exodeoxyribonuclease V subunit alpha [Catenovulum agarivorans DS-2]|uniref:RecBCD enzyme subunit RecD n=1 Tax=Catenovulum agarivorans DS-2 TaxID=1328313 RepID=W7QTY1_9ALTE|nr:exodeoxyribonuclease V subunit alpha [Catenovulum agarivorans]EWH11298.1 exodeoxyribonuclease V subunit alpha [Catenovulum agarivorans DS-2]